MTSVQTPGDRGLSSEELRLTLLEYEAILENASVGIIFTRRVMHCNRKASDIFGRPHGELAGQPGSVFWLSDQDYAEVGRSATPILTAGNAWDAERPMRARTAAVSCAI